MISTSHESNYQDDWQRRLDRQQYDATVTVYVGDRVEKGPHITDTYKRLLEVEERLFPDGDYIDGSARVDDEVLVLNGLHRVLMTAEHASAHMRIRDDITKSKEPDMGTAALAEVVAQDTNSTALIAIGKQTGDANDTEVHPFKAKIDEVVKAPNNRAHFALHMLDRGRASDPSDQRGYSIILGVGKKPSEATLELTDNLLSIGADLGLRVGVNVPHIIFRDSKLILNDDGSLKTVIFASAWPSTSRSYSQNLAQQLGKDDSFAAVQMEINEVLLVKQNDEVGYPTETDRELGSYLGYLFVKLAVESLAKL